MRWERQIDPNVCPQLENTKTIVRYSNVLWECAIRTSKIKIEHPASTLTVPDVYLSG